ncbi:MAG: hypothetical protein ABIP75_03150 [Pyrinomonadaceae bacterium]
MEVDLLENGPQVDVDTIAKRYDDCEQAAALVRLLTATEGVRYCAARRALEAAFPDRESGIILAPDA